MKKTIYRVIQCDDYKAARTDFNNENEAMELFNKIKPYVTSASVKKRIYKKGLFSTKLIETENIAEYHWYDE